MSINSSTSQKRAAVRCRPLEETWTGTLTVPSTGSYWIYLQLLSAAGSVSIDGKRVAGANGMRAECMATPSSAARMA